MPALRRQNREVAFRPPCGGRAPGAGRMPALFCGRAVAGAHGMPQKDANCPLQAAAGETWPRGRRYTDSSAQAASRAIRQSVDSAEKTWCSWRMGILLMGNVRAKDPAVAARGNKGHGRAQTLPGETWICRSFGGEKGGRGCIAAAGAGATVLRDHKHHIRRGWPISLFHQGAAPMTALVKDGSICYNIVKTAT